MPNVLISSEIGSEWLIIPGHPEQIGCIAWVCVLSLAHGSEVRASDVICILCKIDLGIFL